ncbi:19772_t:CDS:10 [Funneliformis geosporum]|uniref:19772_t:CDS:1 n=1 Tax=Funneliformis geosporum TaxID=1117311 RepID=A0A9W4SEJ4_9GLOM|nr:19772_t:CDS:10 [Funneliformis geosporum]
MSHFPAIFDTTSEFIFIDAEFSKNIDITKTAFEASGTLEEAIKPYIPLIAVVTTVIDEIIKIYNDVESNNKKFCNLMMDRVQIAENFIKILSRRKQENEKNFRNMKYFLAFARFTEVMKEIRDVVKDVSKLQSYKKFYEFNGLVSDFETVMKDLYFTNSDQRRIDQLALTEDYSEITKDSLEAEENVETEGDIRVVIGTEGNVGTQRTVFAVGVVSTGGTAEAIRTKGVIDTQRTEGTVKFTGTEVAEENQTQKKEVNNGTQVETQRTKRTVEVIGNVEFIKPYIPLIAAVTAVIGDIFMIYENIEYNKKTCNALMDRVQTADIAIKMLNRRMQWNENNFRKNIYYLAFIKFINVMKRIQDFILDVSKLQGYKKLLQIGSIKDKFNNLINDFEKIMNDLKFTITFTYADQHKIDQQALIEDIAEMSRFLDRIGDDIACDNYQINTVFQEVILIKNRLNYFGHNRHNLPIPETFKVKKIVPNELTDPLERVASDRRGKTKPYIVKKLLKKFLKQSIDVACIPTYYGKNFKTHLVILGKLHSSPDILKFYGLSHVENHKVMVFEWAEYGNLREVYNAYDISWTSKVSIALNICRGIIFLHSCSILHHDIRCENILMTSRLEPKIANFEYERFTTDETTNLVDITESFHWLAPEKMRYYDYRYNIKCEVFSFGMLLWELIFQKVPYEHWNSSKIREYVLSNKREKIAFSKASPDIQILQEIYANIIVSAWQDDPQIRTSLQQIFLGLHVLAGSVNDVGDLPLPGRDMEFFTAIMPLRDGIAAHKRNEWDTAWECFNAHAELGNTTAKYWKGYYLWEGYSCQKDRVEASKLYKAAADDGFPDAQLRYAFSLIDNPGIKFNKKIFIEYLIKASDNNSSTAQFNLGDLYFNGKMGVTKDVSLGKKYLNLAALNSHHKAIIMLQSSEITAINTVISETNKIYEVAQYNKKICNALMDRVDIAEIAIKNIERKVQGTSIFEKIIKVMEEIREFMKDISLLQNSTKSLGTISNKFYKLINCFEADMKDLNLITTIDQPAKPHELTGPLGGNPTDRGIIVKKSIKHSIDVAYIPITIQFDDFIKTIAHLTMLEKLRDSDNILKFYGLSHNDDQLVMIYEWAELRNLCNVYNTYDISWTAKVSIALGICRGIIFLHSCSILHHDIRCANVMITARLEPKITNFKHAHLMLDGISKPKRTYYESFPNIDDIINWMAPEKIENFNFNQYDVKCEAFSFGMLLWELAFEKIPYQYWSTHKIKNHVLKKYRESLEIRSNNDERFIENYFKVIKNTWHHNSQERSCFYTIFNELNELIANYQQNGIFQSLIPKDINRLQTESVDELEKKAKEWIEDTIKRKVIKSIAWSEFNSHKRIGAGNFGSVFQAYWSNIRDHVVYKKLFITSDIKYKMWEAFKHEIQIQSRAHCCENIIRVLGICKTPFEYQHDHTINYIILSGDREERMPDTPDKYYELYNKCWDKEPEKRHTAECVYEVLEKLIIDYNRENVLENEDTILSSTSSLVSSTFSSASTFASSTISSSSTCIDDGSLMINLADCYKSIANEENP